MSNIFHMQTACWVFGQTCSFVSCTMCLSEQPKTKSIQVYTHNAYTYLGTHSHAYMHTYKHPYIQFTDTLTLFESASEVSQPGYFLFVHYFDVNVHKQSQAKPSQSSSRNLQHSTRNVGLDKSGDDQITQLPDGTDPPQTLYLITSFACPETRAETCR